MKHLQQLINSFNIFLISLLFWTGIPFHLTYAQTQTFIKSHNLTREGLQFNYNSGQSGGILDITVEGNPRHQHIHLYIDIYTEADDGKYHRIDPIIVIPQKEDHYNHQIITGNNFLFHLRERRLYFIDIYTESDLDVRSELSRDRDQQPILITASWSPFQAVERSEENNTSRSLLDRFSLLLRKYEK